jgi:hypothetical protein
MNWSCSLIIALLVLQTAVTNAQQAPEARILFDAYASKEPTEKWRPAFARAATIYCRALSNAVPVNTPREADWLQGELNSGNVDRLGRAMDSVEFSRFTMRGFVDDCIKTMGAIANGGLNKTAEATRWVEMLRALNDTENMRTYAKRLGVMREGGTLEADPYLIGFLGGIRLEIIDKAVLPLLR